MTLICAPWGPIWGTRRGRQCVCVVLSPAQLLAVIVAQPGCVFSLQVHG